jgi:hypothetical protein
MVWTGLIWLRIGGGVNWIHVVYETAELRIPSNYANFLCDELLQDLRF